MARPPVVFRLAAAEASESQGDLTRIRIAPQAQHLIADPLTGIDQTAARGLQPQVGGRPCPRPPVKIPVGAATQHLCNGGDVAAVVLPEIGQPLHRTS